MVSSSYYDKNAKEYFDKTINVNLEPLYGPFLALIPPRGKILDVGCGSGRDSIKFKAKGYSITAIDSSIEMVRLASKAIGQKALHISFQEIDFHEEFDGIWACSSLLHVPKAEIGDALNRITNALKSKGVLYASFKYGEGEEERSQGLFNNYTEKSFSTLIDQYPSLKKIEMWKTEDVRDDHKGEFWLNVLLEKSF